MVEKEYMKEGSPGEMQLINKEDSPDSTASNKGDRTTHYLWRAIRISQFRLLLSLRPDYYNKAA